MDNTIFYHLLFDELEGRTNGPDNEFRWDGEGWVGTDMNRLWFKSEGFVENGKMTDGDQEALYDRPIPHFKFFDVQAGVRYDLDSSPGRTWGAIGIEGLAPYFFQFAPTFYFSDKGHFAGRITGSYDLLITNRLIAQPQIEMNFYSKSDSSRGVGSGLSEIDTGLRIRYEISRKFARTSGSPTPEHSGRPPPSLVRKAAILTIPVSSSAFAFGTRARDAKLHRRNLCGISWRSSPWRDCVDRGAATT
jgi:copper resistance protein B